MDFYLKLRQTIEIKAELFLLLTRKVKFLEHLTVTLPTTSVDTRLGFISRSNLLYIQNSTVGTMHKQLKVRSYSKLTESLKLCGLMDNSAQY